MTTTTLLESLRTMTNAERLEVIEAASRLIREDLVREELLRDMQRGDPEPEPQQTGYRMEELSEWSVIG